MKEIDASSLLMQMRTMAAQANFEALPASQKSITETEKSDFAELMRKAISEVNNQQQAASRLSEAFEKGDPNVDIAEVMVQMQKANVSFEAITQVRNRLVSAYQDIMNMPI